MMPLTHAQRRVIETSGHLLVDAGAGSGKTTTVVQAICHQLGVTVVAEGGRVTPVATPLTFEQIAAITFTNQAAADLKRKLRAALRAAGRRDLAVEVDAARIGTIHGFCGDLLRDFALRARTRPVRRTLTDGDAAMLRADRAREVLHAALERGGVDGLDALLAGRRLKYVTDWLLVCAEDTGRLARWNATRASLRPHEAALLRLASLVNASHAAHLDARGELDFDRMIVATRDLLVTDDVRRAVQRRIRLLVVDEFQDVDPVQRDIAERLGGLTVATDTSPSRLILVGDPKQSIYRFRRADVTVWNGMAARFDGVAGTVVSLTENFRSKAAILGFVDAVIGVQLTQPVDARAGRQPFEVAYTPLDPRATNSAGDRAVEFMLVPPGDNGKVRAAKEIRALESSGLAVRVRELRLEGHAWRDIAVLLSSWTDVEQCADALRDAGVPFYVQRGEGFWEAREVLDVVLALRAIRDPADDVALVGLLRSPFVGVRDDTLLALARARGGAPLAHALSAVPHERAKLDHAAALLARFAPLRDRLPAHELLQRLLEESGFAAAAALMPDGGQRFANLRKLLRLAGAAPDLSLGEFLREIEFAREREEPVAMERLYADGGDVVTITSIHGAKGLEWPVVIWADLARQRNLPKDAFIPGRDRLAIKSSGADEEESGGKDPVHEAVKAQEMLEGEAEMLRLWYVAATRAKDRLILSGIPLGDLGKTDSPAQRIRAVLPTLGSEAEFEYTSHTGKVYHATVRTLHEHRQAPEPRVEAESVIALPPVPHRVRAGAARLSASQLMSFARDPEMWRRTYVTRFDPALMAKSGATGGRAIIAGQVVHDVLERVVVQEDGWDIDLLLERAIARWDDDPPEAESDTGRAYRAFLRQRVDAATTAPVWRALMGTPGSQRELAFMHLRPDGTAISGAFDLIAREGDSVRILDLKSSAAAAETLAERYRVQAAVYTAAVRAITGTGGCSFELLVLPASESLVVVPVADIDRIITLLRDSAAPSLALDRGERAH